MMGNVALFLVAFTVVILIIVALLCICNVFMFKGEIKRKIGMIYSIILHFISLVFSTISIILCCPRVIDKGSLGFDYIGVIVGILSLLVAVLIGWNIYTVVDFNRKTEKIEKKVEQELVVIKTENQKIKGDYRELEKHLRYTQMEMLFASVFNYAREMDVSGVTEYAIDGYIDALNVALQGDLARDRIDAAALCIREIINVNDAPKVHFTLPLLPDKRVFYFDVLSKIENKNDNIRWLCEYFLQENNVRDGIAVIPQGHFRVMSDYNPDNVNHK